ncbi:MAG: hypothetical protein IPL28_21495, partial [Chloroflexi bacterium]|nr:hypothetical protein [Chloroflexota bacterium]
ANGRRRKPQHGHYSASGGATHPHLSLSNLVGATPTLPAAKRPGAPTARHRAERSATPLVIAGLGGWARANSCATLATSTANALTLCGGSRVDETWGKTCWSWGGIVLARGWFAAGSRLADGADVAERLLATLVVAVRQRRRDYVRPVAPFVAQTPAGRILITSRNGDWGNGTAVPARGFCGG